MQSVDVTRCTVHNGKPLTVLKTMRGLLVNQAVLGDGLWWNGSEQPHHKKSLGSGQGGFAS